jgi:hypothetical protein
MEGEATHIHKQKARGNPPKKGRGGLEIGKGGACPHKMKDRGLHKKGGPEGAHDSKTYKILAKIRKPRASLRSIAFLCLASASLRPSRKAA